MCAHLIIFPLLLLNSSFLIGEATLSSEKSFQGTADLWTDLNDRTRIPFSRVCPPTHTQFSTPKMNDLLTK